jgi:hypothetical protein
LSHLISACVHLRHHDFLWLAEYDTAWATQDTLSANKACAFLACLIHYDLSIAHTIRFLGNNYTGKYNDIPSVIASLHAHGIAKTLIKHYSRVMTLGCPNHFNATTTRDNALLYWRKGNHPSIPAKLNQVLTTMNMSFMSLTGCRDLCRTASSHHSTYSKSRDRKTARSFTPHESMTGTPSPSTP